LDGGTGFDLLKRFEEIGFKVIFVTAFERYEKSDSGRDFKSQPEWPRHFLV